MTHEDAVRRYADWFVANELKRQPQEKLSKLLAENPGAIDSYRQGWIDTGNALVASILSKGELFIKKASYGAFHPSNPTTRRLFTDVTGIDLPSTVSGTKQVIENYCGDALRQYREARDAERDAKEAAARAKEKEAAARLLADAEARVLACSGVTGGAVVDLCRRYGIDLPPQTIGCLRRRVVSIAGDGEHVSMKYQRTKSGGKSYPQGAAEAFGKLVAVLRERNGVTVE